MAKAEPDIELFALPTGLKEAPFDLLKVVLEAIRDRGVALMDGDILVVSSKFLSMAQGRLVKLSSLEPSSHARRIAKTYGLPEGLAELILREADKVIGGVRGFLLTLKDGILLPNAGVDRSNVPQGYAIPYPLDPSGEAERLRQGIERETGRKVSVVICDSRLVAARVGTIGVTIGGSGIEPVMDMRGRRDLYGKPLRVTQMAVADEVCSAAQLVMGEADEGVPLVLVRLRGRAGMHVKPAEKRIECRDVSIELSKCMVISGILEGGRSLLEPREPI